ncbi:16S rRNA (guanine(966)-N(2))-methyltransferase RsmD [Salirhabdus sp. Marseille-P4669]|uniref:16S rRNA (guanine(966)-N(2))-methyltransferase RsmD n=1 Tax=Salirhabdus sp. Marseille-P4669 TaxID=2042310 RepID=UPI000C7BA862|nr:16S rRNA (guanine(966)-N(2))-methyltransferase RsmD [Salirhabdus sp. Marseille-P4669]
MRVISGKWKGHPLKAVPGKGTRPTTDKVKEAIFQIIGPYFEGGIGLDLFAGSGGLGIEAISRGAEKVIFVDQQSAAIATIHKNIKQLNMEDQTEVYRTDAFRALKATAKRELTFDWIFLDPPYGKVSFEKLFETILELQLIQRGSVVICEHTPEQVLPEAMGALKLYKSVNYNAIQVSYYQYA